MVMIRGSWVPIWLSNAILLYPARQTDRPRSGVEQNQQCKGVLMLHIIFLILVSSLLIITRCKDEQDDVPSVW